MWMACPTITANLRIIFANAERFAKNVASFSTFHLV